MCTLPDLTQHGHPRGGSFPSVAGCARTCSCPLFRNGELLGMISCNRTEVRPFSDKEIALIENFAAQAVIAIENARLLSELRELNSQLEQRVSDQVGEIERMGGFFRRFLPPQVADLIVASGTEKAPTTRKPSTGNHRSLLRPARVHRLHRECRRGRRDRAATRISHCHWREDQFKYSEIGGLILFASLVLYTIVATPLWTVARVRVAGCGLLVIVLVPLLLDRPFSLQRARAMPMELCDDALVSLTNVRISAVWGGAFAYMVAADAAAEFVEAIPAWVDTVGQRGIYRGTSDLRAGIPPRSGEQLLTPAVSDWSGLETLPRRALEVCRTQRRDKIGA